MSCHAVVVSGGRWLLKQACARGAMWHPLNSPEAPGPSCGIVTSETNPHDGPGSLVQLLDAGSDLIETALPDNLETERTTTAVPSIDEQTPLGCSFNESARRLIHDNRQSPDVPMGTKRQDHGANVNPLTSDQDQSRGFTAEVPTPTRATLRLIAFGPQDR